MLLLSGTAYRDKISATIKTEPKSGRHEAIATIACQKDQEMVQFLEEKPVW